MNNTFFQRHSLTRYDKVSIGLYTVFTIAILWILTSEGNFDKRQWIFAYGFGTHLLMYFFLYVSLRNIWMFFIWLLFGLLHLYLYLSFLDEDNLKFLRTNSLTPLRNTTIILFLFQFLRWTFLKLTKQQLVAPSKSRYDLFDERQWNLLDMIWLIAYLSIVIILNSIDKLF